MIHFLQKLKKVKLNKPLLLTAITIGCFQSDGFTANEFAGEKSLFSYTTTTNFSPSNTIHAVKGKVTNSSGEGLVGVTVLLKGTTIGAATDINGDFMINIPDGTGTLVFSYIGFNSEEILVNNQTTINISLMEDLVSLNEFVVTALGIKREKKALGYAVSDVSEKDIVGNGETNAISSIAGKVAGVNISSTTSGPSGSSRVVIRGVRELQGNNQPLYVIDGVPAVNGNIGSADQNGGFDLGDGLADLNPNDIESISVLKGSSAAVLYGSRALNGVILITTKSGRARKGIGVEYNSSLTIDKISTRLDEVQKTYGQGNNGVLPRAASEAGNITSNWGPRYSDASEVVQKDGQIRPYKYIDNNAQDFFRDGKTWMHTIGLNAGNSDQDLRLSFSNVTNDDIIPKSGLERNSISLKASSKVTEKLSVDGKASYLVEKVKNRPALTDDVNNIGNGLIGLAGNFDQEWLKNYSNPDGSYIDYTGDIYRANPYWTINRTKNRSTKERVNGYVALNYQFNDMFSLNVKGGTDFFTFRHQNFYDKNTPTKTGGLLTELETTVKENNYQGMLNFKKDLNEDFDISASIGGNLMKYQSSGNSIQASQIVEAGQANLINFNDVFVTPFNRRKEIQSVFGTAQVGYKNYLFVNFQGRNDWASTLAPAKTSFFYPAVDMGFVATDAFHITSKWLSFGKLRAAWGQVGSDFDPYKTSLTYGLTGRSINGQALGEIYGGTIPNANLRPQIKTSFEIGTDIRFLDNRVGLDLTYYNETTDDVLLEITVPEASGYSRAALNAAKLQNKGVEILLTATPVELSNGFKWNFSFNYAKNKNKVVELNEMLETFTVAEARWAGVTIVAQEGKPFGTIMGAGYKVNADGNRVFNSSNGRPMATDSAIEIGNTLPNWTGGLINSFSYKGFELKAALDIRMGGDIFSMTNLAMYRNGSHADTEAGRDSWNQYQKERREAEAAGLNPDDVSQDGRGYVGVGVNEDGAVNTTAINPADYYGAIANNIPQQFVYDGSYVKLRDLGLSYTINKSTFKKLPFQSVTFGVIGRNLLILHKNVPNIDPESNYNNGNGQGFEYGSLPGRRRFGFNLTVKL